MPHPNPGLYRGGVEVIMEHLFSKRYEELLQGESSWLGGDDDGAVPYNVKVIIARVMEDFRQPISIQPNRYDSYTVDTDALNLAIHELNERVDYRVVDLDMTCMDSDLDETHALASIYTPHLFDLIELQYEELSDDPENGKDDFRGEINEVLREHDIPWLLIITAPKEADGLSQFVESPLVEGIRVLEFLHLAEGLELQVLLELSGVDLDQPSDYAEAVINAEKSYESVLKVICGPGSETEAANVLVRRLLEAGKLSLPEGLKPEAFRSNVLMSLPTIRNKAAAHGSGATGCEVSGPMANLAVNLACALDTYFIQETTGKE